MAIVLTKAIPIETGQTNCDIQPEDCALKCAESGFFGGLCQAGKCVCERKDTGHQDSVMDQNPVCTMGGNVSCHVYCNDVGYLAGFCDDKMDCCCTYGITYGECYIPPPYLKDDHKMSIERDQPKTHHHQKSEILK